jgi:hypothetical protein
MDGMWASRLYLAARGLVLSVAAVLRALLAAAILAEDLVIQARSWVLVLLAHRRERRAAAPVRVTAAGPAPDPDGAVTGRVVALEELRRARASRQEPA